MCATPGGCAVDLGDRRAPTGSLAYTYRISNAFVQGASRGLCRR